MLTVKTLSAMEILDSRARPTLSVDIELSGGARAHVGVPAGASTGTREAKELRDGDPARYAGQGVLQAVGFVNGEIADALRGRAFADVADLDQTLIALDGTPNKHRLGANAIVGVSMAAARACAVAAGQPLWRFLAPDGMALKRPRFFAAPMRVAALG